jgi:hypothetical protein
VLAYFGAGFIRAWGVAQLSDRMSFCLKGWFCQQCLHNVQGSSRNDLCKADLKMRWACFSISVKYIYRPSYAHLTILHSLDSVSRTSISSLAHSQRRCQPEFPLSRTRSVVSSPVSLQRIFVFQSSCGRYRFGLEDSHTTKSADSVISFKTRKLQSQPSIMALGIRKSLSSSLSIQRPRVISSSFHAPTLQTPDPPNSLQERVSGHLK